AASRRARARERRAVPGLGARPHVDGRPHAGRRPVRDDEPVPRGAVSEPAPRRRQVSGGRRPNARQARRGAALGHPGPAPGGDEFDYTAGRDRKTRRRLRRARHRAVEESDVTERYELHAFDRARPEEIEEALERAEVVFFERCPVELPNEDDLAFLREGLPREFRAKNVSYHPESDSIPRFDAAPEVKERVERILRTHGQRVEEFLRRAVPSYVRGWTVGTTSFRAVEEKGRKLKPRSSNELVHVDAGAYGATNGARILRFFVNVHPERERIWGTKGSFAALLERHPELRAAALAGRPRVKIEKSALDRLFSGIVGAAGKLYPLLKVIDSSPYDRSM